MLAIIIIIVLSPRYPWTQGSVLVKKQRSLILPQLPAFVDKELPPSLSSDWHLEVSVFLWKTCWHISPEDQSGTAKFLWHFIRQRLCSLMLHFVVTLSSQLPPFDGIWLAHQSQQVKQNVHETGTVSRNEWLKSKGAFCNWEQGHGQPFPHEWQGETLAADAQVERQLPWFLRQK